MHLAKLCLMCEELTSLRHSPNDSEFYAIVMGSLPPSYNHFVSVIDATFRTTISTHLAISISTGSTDYIPPSLSPDNLIQSVTDEYERRLLHQKAGKKDAENVAFYSNDSSKGNKGSSSSKPLLEVECFNCHKFGHYKSDCWAKGGPKEGQRPKRGNRDTKGKGKGKDKDNKCNKKGKGEGRDKDAANNAIDDLPLEAWMTLYVDDYADLPETPPPAPRALSVAYHAAIGILAQLHAEEYTNASAWLSDNDKGQSNNDNNMPSLQSISDSEDDESDYEDNEEVLPRVQPVFDILLYHLPPRDDSDDDEDMPGLQNIPDLDSESDLEYVDDPSDFSDEESDFDKADFFENMSSDDNDIYLGSSEVIPIDNEAYATTYTVEELSTPSVDANIDLNDSGATRHMSGAKHCFINFVEIAPKPISAADSNRSFDAMGKGDMLMHIPNGSDSVSEVLLKDMLFAPKMSVTLVSISRIVESRDWLFFDIRRYDLQNFQQRTCLHRKDSREGGTLPCIR